MPLIRRLSAPPARPAFLLLLLLCASCAGHAASPATPPAGATHKGAAAAPPISAIEGQVTDSDGRPVADALVAANRADKPDYHSERVARSGPDGRFRLAPLSPGPYGLTATMTSHPAAFTGGVQVASGATAGGVALVAAAAGFVLSGTVRGPAGEPVPGAELRLARINRETAGDLFLARADASGAYRVMLPVAPYVVFADGPGFSAENTFVRLDGDRAVDLTLDRQGQAAAPAPPEVVEWLKHAAVPLATVEAGHGFDDLAPLKKIVGSARVVGLGEATHGSREFFQLKQRLIEFLASEMGFEVIAIEAPADAALAINDYLRTGRGDPSRLVAELGFFTLDTQEMVELVRWMRRANERAVGRRRLRFHGFDMQVREVAVERVLAYLRRVDRAYAEKAEPIVAAFRAIQGAPGGADRNGSPSGRIGEVVTRLRERQATYVARSDAAAWRLAEHLAVQLADIQERRQNPEARDRQMADNIEWIQKTEGGAKMVLWAHNDHLTFAELMPGVPAMGSYIRKRLGEDYRIFGVAFRQGGFTATRSEGRARVPIGLTPCAVGPAPEGYLETGLGKAGLPIFALDLRAPAPAAVGQWLTMRHPTRSIGAAYSETDETIIMRVAPRNRYDALLFVDRVAAARPNPTLVVDPGGDVVARIEPPGTVRDPSGRVVLERLGGELRDAQGHKMGSVSRTALTDDHGQPLARFEPDGAVRDAKGQLVWRVTPEGAVEDAAGRPALRLRGTAPLAQLTLKCWLMTRH